MHTLAHQLTLLDLDDRTGLSRTSKNLSVQFALAAALVCELELQERWGAVAADRFALRAGPPLDGVLGDAAALLSRKKPYTQKDAIRRLQGRHTRLRRRILEDLVADGTLEVAKDKLWIVTWRTRWPTRDPRPEADLRAHLRGWLDGAGLDLAPGREDLLLGLLRVCKILDAVWSAPDLARLDARIKERTRRAPIGQVVRVCVRDAEAAAAAAASVAAIG